MNDFLATLPFDLYELSLVRLVAAHGSFTRACRKAGLTQSAMTRQIRGLEDQLGVSLFERTTRQVRPTATGLLLCEQAEPILAAAEEILRNLRQSFGLGPQILRVGIARSIGLSYYPGFFFAFRKRSPKVQLHVMQLGSQEILDAVDEQRLDAGLLSPPRRLPRALTATHRFTDEFTVILPPDSTIAGGVSSTSVRALRKLLAQERWLLLDRTDETGRALRRWLAEQDWTIEPAMELDSFDVIANLVSLGLGVSLVPHRVLALWGDRRRVRRLAIRPRFVRELAVVVRKNRVQPELLRILCPERAVLTKTVTHRPANVSRGRKDRAGYPDPFPVPAAPARLRPI